MRILLHSNAPWIGSGYGQQAAVWAPRWASLGHDVAISAFCGLTHARTEWRGHPVYPGGMNPYGGDVIAGSAAAHKADLVITLMDAWGLPAQVCRDLGAVCWMPVDCAPLGILDKGFLRASGCTAVAMSEFGREQLSEAGFAPYYVPHGIDTQVFRPGDKAAARERLGVPADAFIAGVNAANSSKRRKAWPEMMAAFAQFRMTHPGALLLAHTSAPGPGLKLDSVAGLLGLGESVRWSDQYKYSAGQFTQDDMVTWYQALDVLLGTARGEGFGLPLLEAQSCGVPVIATNFSAMTEVTGAGWLVDGELDFEEGHCAWWMTPRISEIAEALQAAFDGGASEPGMAEKARDHALKYDADAILPQWDRLLGILEEQLA